MSLCCLYIASLMMLAALQQTTMVMSRSIVAETNDTVYVTDGPSSASILNITSEDVEQRIQRNDAVIIDVRTFNEAAEFGQIPSAHVLPGCSTYICAVSAVVRYWSTNQAHSPFHLFWIGK